LSSWASIVKDAEGLGFNTEDAEILKEPGLIHDNAEEITKNREEKKRLGETLVTALQKDGVIAVYC